MNDFSANQLRRVLVSGVFVIFASCAMHSPNGTTSAPTVSTMSHPPLRTVAHLNLPRYMGDWRVIANIPYFAEKDCVDSIETYRLKPDGTIFNGFTFRKKSFDAPQQKIEAEAWVYNKETNAEWRIRFFGLITVKYLVLAVDPDYQWTIVGHPSRKFGWIMAREKTMPYATYQMLLKKLDEIGYDSKKFAKVPQVR